MASKTLTDALVLGALPPLAAGYARFVHATTRWRREGQAHLGEVLGSGAPFACAFWHGRLLMMFGLLEETGRPCTAMVSAHRDGEAIARTLSRLGVDAVRGSAADPAKPHKAKGGAGALRALLLAMRGGANAAITPDGPRGPRQRCQPGVALAAKLSGAPVLPVAWATERAVVLGSWDRFVLPLPFGRGVFVFGAPVSVTGEDPDAMEAARREVEEALNAVTARADEAVGRAPCPPARLGVAVAA